METSAKTAMNVNELFLAIGKSIAYKVIEIPRSNCLNHETSVKINYRGCKSSLHSSYPKYLLGGLKSLQTIV